jgi:hypothetical protein
MNIPLTDQTFRVPAPSYDTAVPGVAAAFSGKGRVVYDVIVAPDDTLGEELDVRTRVIAMVLDNEDEAEGLANAFGLANWDTKEAGTGSYLLTGYATL